MTVLAFLVPDLDFTIMFPVILFPTVGLVQQQGLPRSTHLLERHEQRDSTSFSIKRERKSRSLWYVRTSISFKVFQVCKGVILITNRRCNTAT